MSLVDGGSRWRYQLEQGGVEEVALSDPELRGLALDQRLQRRLQATTTAELEQFRDLLADTMTGDCPRQAVLAWRADEAQTLVPELSSSDGAINGVSPIGERIQLLVPGAPLPEDLAARVLRWGCGRVSPVCELIQLAVLPAVGDMRGPAEALANDWTASGARTVCLTEATLARRLRDCWLRQIPLMIVVAPDEWSDGLVELRQRGSRQGTLLPVATATSQIRQRLMPPG